MDTRQKIIEAAERVMRERGLARSTTKEIARAARYSEGTLYKYFESKEDLFLAVLAERLPSLITTLEDLPARAGRGSIRVTLEEVVRMALAFYAETTPIAGSVLAEPTLLANHAAAITRKGRGPHTPNAALATYLRAEQERGRVRRDANPDAAAALLLGACFQRVFLRHFFSQAAVPAHEERFAADIAGMLVDGLAPNGDRSRIGR